MAARSTWKGYLKVSLVNIPVRVFPATESAAALSSGISVTTPDPTDATASAIGRTSCGSAPSSASTRTQNPDSVRG